MLLLGELDVDPWRRTWLRRTAEVIRFYLLQYDIDKFYANYL